MAAIYSLYIINKSGGLIFYKVRSLHLSLVLVLDLAACDFLCLENDELIDFI